MAINDSLAHIHVSSIMVLVGDKLKGLDSGFKFYRSLHQVCCTGVFDSSVKVYVSGLVFLPWYITP